MIAPIIVVSQIHFYYSYKGVLGGLNIASTVKPRALAQLINFN